MPSCKDGLSPVQKLFGHPIQDTLPAHRRAFVPEWQGSALEAEQQATDTQDIQPACTPSTDNQHWITCGSTKPQYQALGHL